MSIFWDTVLPIMAQKGITQVDIGNIFNKSKGTVNSWIKRDTIPPADYALKIADFLGEDLRYLITGKRSEEVVFHYRNKDLKPIVDLLDDKPKEVLKMAYAGVKAVIGVSTAASDDKSHKKIG